MKMPTAKQVSPPKGAFSHIACLFVYIQAALQFLKTNPLLLAWQRVLSSRSTCVDVRARHVYAVQQGELKGCCAGQSELNVVTDSELPLPHP